MFVVTPVTTAEGGGRRLRPEAEGDARRTGGLGGVLSPPVGSEAKPRKLTRFGVM